jgi:hypothetical protein
MLKTVGFPSTRTGDQTIVDGNLVIGTSGKGIDFSATPGTGTSELLADYEEGTWAIADSSGAGLSLSVTDSRYTKIGRVVYVLFYVTYPVTADASQASLTLPFVPNGFAQITGRFGAVVNGVWQCTTGSAVAILHTINGGAAVTNASLSGQYLICSGSFSV